MKIAVITPTAIPARRANTIQVMKMSQALVGLGYIVRLAAPLVKSNGNDEPDRSWENLALHYGLASQFPIDWLPASPGLRSYDFGLRAVRWSRLWEADVIYTRLPQAAALASLRGMDTIFEVHDLPQGYLGPMLFRLYQKGKGARRLVAITRALAGDLQKRFGIPDRESFVVIAPDGVDLGRYENLPSPTEARRILAGVGGSKPVFHFSSGNLLLHPDRFIAGYSGHLYAGRGVELLLDLAERLPDIFFLLVGGDPQAVQQFQGLAVSRALKNVIFTGFVPNAELPLYQAACDALLMPYQHRVAASSGGDIAPYLSPMKLFEYMALQRAIVAPDQPNIREILVDGRDALLFNVADPAAFTEAILRLTTDRALRRRLAERAGKTVRDRQLTWARNAQRVIELGRKFGAPAG